MYPCAIWLCMSGSEAGVGGLHDRRDLDIPAFSNIGGILVTIRGALAL